jgi:peptide deformylase
MRRFHMVVTLVALQACSSDRHNFSDVPSQSLNPDTSTADKDVVVEPDSTSVLGRAAKQLQVYSRGIMMYSPKFFREHPYAAGSFQREQNTLIIDKETFDNPNKPSAVLEHELLHAKVFGELKTRTRAPWYGYFTGESFAPNALYLDEALAYQHDLIFAAKDLSDFLAHTSGPLNLETLNEIRTQVETRFRGEPLPKGTKLSPIAAAVDQVAKKILHGEWHSAPAAEALAVLPRSEQICVAANFREEFGVTVASADTTVENKPARVHLSLIESGGVADPRNCALSQKERNEAEKFAADSARLFRSRKQELTAILAGPASGAVTQLRQFAAELAAAKLPVPGASLRRDVPSHTSPAGKKVLRRAALPVSEFNAEMFSLLASMRATVVAENGVGVAAPQIGESKRVMLVKRLDILPDKPFVAYINPKIIWQSPDTTEDWEGCLSVPEGMGRVTRAKSIRVQARNQYGQEVDEMVSDYVARIFQHEIDHLDGILFVDRKKPGALVSKDEVRRLRRLDAEKAADVPAK